MENCCIVLINRKFIITDTKKLTTTSSQFNPPHIAIMHALINCSPVCLFQAVAC